MSAIRAGRVNTAWKYGTGSSSASRSASHSFAAAPWHFGQCRLRARHARRASGRRRGRLKDFDEMIERANHLTDRFGRNARVERRGIELGVAEQDLDHADIDALLQ